MLWQRGGKGRGGDGQLCRKCIAWGMASYTACEVSKLYHRVDKGCEVVEEGGERGGGSEGGRREGFQTHLKDHPPGKTRPNLNVHIHLHSLASVILAAAGAIGHGYRSGGVMMLITLVGRRKEAALERPWIACACG